MKIFKLIFLVMFMVSCSNEFDSIPDGYDYNSYKKALFLSEKTAKDYVLNHNLSGDKINENLIRKIISAVKSDVAYKYDKIHTIKTAQQTLHDEAGDCEDHAILVAAILKELNIKTTIIRRNEITKGEPGHVFAAYAVDDARYMGQRGLLSCGTVWLALDTTFESETLSGELGINENFNGSQYRCFNKEDDKCCLPL